MQGNATTATIAFAGMARSYKSPARFHLGGTSARECARRKHLASTPSERLYAFAPPTLARSSTVIALATRAAGSARFDGMISVLPTFASSLNAAT